MAEFELDCMGEACPVPLMKTEKKLKDLKSGDVLIVHIDGFQVLEFLFGFH